MDSFKHFCVFASGLLLYDRVLLLMKLQTSDIPTPWISFPSSFLEAVI